MDSERDVLRYQGQEYDVIAIDEATQLTEYQFSTLKACLRGANGLPKRMYLTCNPGGVGHAWVKRLFIDRVFKANENPADYSFIPAKVYDNEILVNSDPEYVRQLESLPHELKEAWLCGNWDIFEGQFFSEFSRETHVIKPFDTSYCPHHWAAMDYGFDMLAVLWLSSDSNGNIFIERELTQSGLTLSKAAELTASYCDSTTEYIVASPDLWNRRQDSGRSGFELMQAIGGMPSMVAADDRRVAGWRVVREYLSESDASPRLFISRRCPELIRCMSALLCDPDRPEDASDEPHGVTHCPEALRYGLMSRSTPPRENQKKRDPFAFAFERPSALKDYLN
jgi:phage terminase large subunit